MRVSRWRELFFDPVSDFFGFPSVADVCKLRIWWFFQKTCQLSQSNSKVVNSKTICLQIRRAIDILGSFIDCGKLKHHTRTKITKLGTAKLRSAHSSKSQIYTKFMMVKAMATCSWIPADDTASRIFIKTDKAFRKPLFNFSASTHPTQQIRIYDSQRCSSAPYIPVIYSSINSPVAFLANFVLKPFRKIVNNFRSLTSFCW